MTAPTHHDTVPVDEDLDGPADLGNVADTHDVDHDDDVDDVFAGEVTSSLALFEGDEGGLDLAQRRALVLLVKQRFVTARSHPREWRALVADPAPIRARLHDLFLDLHLDRDREVAYKRQVTPEGGGRFPTLLYDTPWNREETLLLVYLRGRYRSEQAAGADRVFVDVEDMLDHVAAHRPPHATDLSGDTKRAQRAVDSLFKAGLLVGASTADRFEVSAAIEVLLPLEKLQQLLGWIQDRTTGTDDTDTPPDTETEADGEADGLPETDPR